MPSPVPDDHSAYPADDLQEILERAGTIAVVGASPDPARPSFGVATYLRRAGYKVIPVNPTALGASLLGQPFHANLREIAEPVDIVDVFRRPEFVPAVVEDTIAIGAPVLWLQLGISHPQAASRAEAAGIKVIMNRCISIEHSCLLG